jgi:predicted ATPase/DNA-binding winged helix-turn-helix (wHTH) protein
MLEELYFAACGGTIIVHSAKPDSTFAVMDYARPKLIYQSGQLEVDVARRELRVRGVHMPIGGRAFEIIEVLAKAAGNVVTKDDLMARVWPGAIVEESTLWVHISAVRKALGIERGRLKTISRRGYQLLGSWRISGNIAPVSEIDSQTSIISASPAIAHNLPTPGTSLIGRQLAVRELRNLLSAYRMVTLTGPGGIGKSRLALEAAREMLGQPRADVRLVEFASLSDPDLVPSAIARVLGLRGGAAELTAEVIARAIGQRPLLLLLDNCEHIVDAVARLAETIVQICPHATILATSREVLRIDGEYVYKVLPLDVPHVQDPPDDILRSSAVQLFVARTAAIRSPFSPDETNLSDIVSICQRLDGIPLAIEFAAARAATLGVSQVNSHLDDRFNFLTAGRRTTLARHQTLRATLDWSYDLLSAPEQRLLRHLSIFPAGFTLEATSAVIHNADRETTVAEGLANLVGKSLVMLDGSTSGGRWRVLETIRAYGLEKLRESGEIESALRRHAEYYLTLFKRGEAEVLARPTAEWIADYAREIDNLRTALNWAFSPGGGGSIGVALTAAAVPLWMRLSLLEECCSRTKQALDALGSGEILDPREAMRLHAALGASTPDSSEMGEALTKALDIAESLGDSEYQLRALRGLSFYHSGRNRYRDALPFAQKFHDLAARGADPGDQMFGERMMGVVKCLNGDHIGARRHLEQVLTHDAAADHGRDVIRFQVDARLSARVFLSRVLWLQGFSDQSVRTAAISFGEARATGHAMSVCHSLAWATCSIALWTGNLAAAARYTRMLLDYSREHGLTHWSEPGFRLQAILGSKGGDLDTQDYGNTPAPTKPPRTASTVGLLAERAEAFVRVGRIAEGLAVIESGFGQSEPGWVAPELSRLRGELLLSQGTQAATKTAERLFRQALDEAYGQGALAWELRAATSLARLLRDKGRPAEAMACLQPIYNRFTEGFDTADLIESKHLLNELAT